MSERWMVVDKNRACVWGGMYSQANAEEEAARLNTEGMAEFRPYRVVRDVVAETT